MGAAVGCRVGTRVAARVSAQVGAPVGGMVGAVAGVVVGAAAGAAPGAGTGACVRVRLESGGAGGMGNGVPRCRGGSGGRVISAGGVADLGAQVVAGRFVGVGGAREIGVWAGAGGCREVCSTVGGAVAETEGVGGGAATGRGAGRTSGRGRASAVAVGGGGAGANGSTTNSPCGMSGKGSPPGSRISSRPCKAGEGTRLEGCVSCTDRSIDCVQCDGFAAPVVASTRFSEALNTSAQRPQRTQPAETRNWSGTTRNTVWHDGQREASLAAGGVIRARPQRPPTARAIARPSGSSPRRYRALRCPGAAHRLPEVVRPGVRGCRPSPASRPARGGR